MPATNPAGRVASLLTTSCSATFFPVIAWGWIAVVLLGGCGAKTGLQAADVSSDEEDADVLPDAESDAEVVSVAGCSDGERESFVDFAVYSDVAGCAGGWDIPGVYVVQPPACGRRAGDDGPNPNGMGCNVEDLCEAGWHVCRSAGELSASSPDGCAGAAGASGSFFATRQSGPGRGECATGTTPGCAGSDAVAGCAPNDETTNDIFGCGGTGDLPAESCWPLDRFGHHQCHVLPPPWSCNSSGTDEALVVIKPGPEAGGVICCRD